MAVSTYTGVSVNAVNTSVVDSLVLLEYNKKHYVCDIFLKLKGFHLVKLEIQEITLALSLNFFLKY